MAGTGSVQRERAGAKRLVQEKMREQCAASWVCSSAVFEHAHATDVIIVRSLFGRVTISCADDDAVPIGGYRERRTKLVTLSKSVDVPAENSRKRRLEFSRVCVHVKVRD